MNPFENLKSSLEVGGETYKFFSLPAMKDKRYGRLGLVWFSCLNEIWLRYKSLCAAMKDKRYGRFGLTCFSCLNEIWKYGYGTKAYEMP